jgi:octaprenyl-diphosphate synthase
MAREGTVLKMIETGVRLNLREIAEPVRQHLDTFEDVFKASIRSKIGLVDLVTRYIIKQKGKRVRPILVLLSAELCGGVNERSYRGATLVEILHTATLIHDDVIDDADTRRGLASINAIWKNKIAILIGDYLLARGLLLSLEHDDFQFLKITSTSVRRMSEGEIHQIQKSRQLDLDEETYLKIIGDKTASLISTCCEIGATSSSDDPEQRALLREYGEKVGLAFQIRDDVLDYVGRRSITGKPTGLDFSEKKLTLPLIHALEHAPKTEAKEILSMIRNGGKRMKARQVVDFVSGYGGIDYASRRALAYATEAKEKLVSFADSAAKQSLVAFADFVVDREK